MINIIKATKEHLPEILRIGQELISPSWTYNFLSNEFNNSDSKFLTAINDSVCGFIIFRHVGDDGEILQVAVDKRMQRSGIGDLLIDAVVNYAREKNLKSIFLEVRKSNTAAEHLYIKHGFKSVRVRNNYYSDPVEDAVVMAVEIRDFN